MAKSPSAVTFALSSRGQQAGLHLPDKYRDPLDFQDILDLISYTAAKGPRPDWCHLNGGRTPSELTTLVQVYPKDLDSEQKVDHVLEFLPPPNSGEDAAKCSKMELLLSLDQLIEDGFPLLIPGQYQEKFGHYIPTKKEYKQVTNDSPLFAIDCEMVRTRGGEKFALSEICLVDEHFRVIMQAVVAPSQSMIMSSKYQRRLQSCSVQKPVITLQEIQENIRQILPADAILVGHLVSSDLNVLEMVHPYILDTSVIYCLKKNEKPKLAVLSELLLGISIQVEGIAHDPLEDACASLRLALLKLEKGYSFGDIHRPRCDVPRAFVADFHHKMATFMEALQRQHQTRILVLADNSTIDKYRIRMKDTSSVTFQVADSSSSPALRNYDLVVSHTVFLQKLLSDQIQPALLLTLSMNSSPTKLALSFHQ